MGMFDREPNLTSDERCRQPFELLGGEYLGLSDSADYGKRPKARVNLTWPGENEIQTFSVYGVMADQVNRMANGDVPATVRVEQQGNANAFVKVESA